MAARQDKIGTPEQIRKRRGIADRKTASFVQGFGRGIKGDGGVPEMPHHLHPAGIVPDIQRHRAARPHDAPHFRKRARRIRNEIQDEVRDGGIDRAIRQRQRLSIADPEGQAQIAHMRPRVVEIAGRGIDREHRSRRAVVEDGPAQRAGAAPDVEPREAGRQRQPARERAGDGPAPPPHIRLVRIAGGPHICGRFRNHGRAPCPTLDRR